MGSLKSLYKENIEEIKQEVFEKLPLDVENQALLESVAIQSLSKFILEFLPDVDIHLPRSGVVVVGYGKKDIFPSLYSLDISGVIRDKVNYRMKERKISDECNAGISPFAQREMVVTFMEGIDPTYKSFIENRISEILELYTNSIMDVVNEQTKVDTTSIEETCKHVNDIIAKIITEFLREYSRKIILNQYLMWYNFFLKMNWHDGRVVS